MTWLLHFVATEHKEYIVLTDDEDDGDGFADWKRVGYKLLSATDIVNAPVDLPTEEELTFGNVEL